MRDNKKNRWIIWALLLLFAGLTGYLGQSLEKPVARLVDHWGGIGQANGEAIGNTVNMYTSMLPLAFLPLFLPNRLGIRKKIVLSLSLISLFTIVLGLTLLISYFLGHPEIVLTITGTVSTILLACILAKTKFFDLASEAE